jgi:nitroimidazol reductase NimA-like FMN-containing flavoprotein (pyridoxamine 5'-phosphate oxidase superfamily)
MVSIQFKTRKDAIEGFYVLTFNGGFVGLPNYVCVVDQGQLKDLKAQKIKFRVLEEAEKHESKKVRNSAAAPI